MHIFTDGSCETMLAVSIGLVFVRLEFNDNIKPFLISRARRLLCSLKSFLHSLMSLLRSQTVFILNRLNKVI